MTAHDIAKWAGIIVMAAFVAAQIMLVIGKLFADPKGPGALTQPEEEQLRTGDPHADASRRFADAGAVVTHREHN